MVTISGGRFNDHVWPTATRPIVLKTSIDLRFDAFMIAQKP